MAEPEDKILSDTIPEPDRVVAFRSDEMIACSGCGRANAPNRASCMYCAAALEYSDEAELKLSGREPEVWGPGHNVVATGGRLSTHAATFSDRLRLSAGAMEALANGLVPFPLLRIEDAAEAEYAARELERAGLACRVLGDRELAGGAQPMRVRGLEFGGGEISFRLFNSEETATVQIAALVLALAGTVRESKSRFAEKRKRGEYQARDEVHDTTERRIIDVYATDAAFRIVSQGFDFSCLGAAKTMIVNENMRLLVERLSAEGIAVADEYDSRRELLNDVWPPDARSDRAPARSGMFAVEDRVRTERTDNAAQFDRYSRLRRLLI